MIVSKGMSNSAIQCPRPYFRQKVFCRRGKCNSETKMYTAPGKAIPAWNAANPKDGT